MKRVSFIIFVLLLILLPAGKVEAKILTLKLNKTYKKFDITGDKKKDKLKISADLDSNGYIHKLAVKVKGKTVLKKTYNPGSDANLITNRVYPQVKLIKLKAKKPLLYIHFSTCNGYYAGGWVYHYKSKKMKLLLKTEKLTQDYATKHPSAWRCYEILKSANGNDISFDIGSMAESTSVTYRYRYKKGKLIYVK